MDKFLSGFGMGGLMNSMSGGNNSSTASPADSRSNSPKPPPAQTAKVCIVQSLFIRGRCGHCRMVVGFKLPLKPVLITSNVVRLNTTQARCTRYNIMR